MSGSRYIVRRVDQRIDDVLIESEGLTIGRLPGNELVLNHRAVDATHAGVKEINGRYWVFNLSSGSGVVVNGNLVERVVVKDGDTMQCGPYLLRFTIEKSALAIAVEAGASLRIEEGAEDPPDRFADRAAKSAGPEALPDQQTLRVFWEKRKRELGKIRERTILDPSGRGRLGKALACWSPTLDLRAPWRSSYFLWAGAGVLVCALFALVAWRNAFGPGPLASPHTAKVAPTHSSAVRPSAGACSACHSPTASVEAKCVECHRVPAFAQAVSEAHVRAGLDCASCHVEHRGREVAAGLTTNRVCIQCHTDSAPVHEGLRAGRVLGAPHRGGVGYPVVDGRWRWKGLSAAQWRVRGLSEYVALRPVEEQFHAIHRAAMTSENAPDRMECGECHGTAKPARASSPRALAQACEGCHAARAGTAAASDNCVGCHAPHGPSRAMQSLIARAGGDFRKLRPLIQSAAMNSAPTARDASPRIGGMPWFGWVACALLPLILGIVRVTTRSGRLRSALESTAQAPAAAGPQPVKTSDGPSYPHPVVDPVLCIGCHACVSACPHDVLAIVNGVAAPVALDQCMEDTGCVVECPTNPKACRIVNGTKKIPARRVPRRYQTFMTDAPGVYLIGDASGIPLIKNAINEGVQVIHYVTEDLAQEGPNPAFEFDLAIIGVGSGGFSAALTAHGAGLKYVAIEQGRMANTLQRYPAGKYVFFKPDSVEARGGVPLLGAGMRKEDLLDLWARIAEELDVHEMERCTGIKRVDGGFEVGTFAEKDHHNHLYRARRIILAIGNSGSPLKLGVPGEDLKTSPSPGAKPAPRVRYNLSDPADLQGAKCVIVGAGNSAIEAAVDLTGLRRRADGSAEFTRDNEVTLVVRSDFKGDLKLGNKINVYDCIDAGRIKVLFGTTVKEIFESEITLADARSGEEKGRIANDVVFALIGTERPTKFLEALGIHIEGGDRDGGAKGAKSSPAGPRATPASGGV